MSFLKKDGVEKVKPDPWNLSVHTVVGSKLGKDKKAAYPLHAGGRFFVGSKIFSRSKNKEVLCTLLIRIF